MSKRIALVAAYARNRVISRDGDIPWHLPADFAHFKRETLGHTLVMGRATYDSIGRPLPGRRTIVITRDENWTAGEYADAVVVAHSVDEALALAQVMDGDIMIAGGGQIYEQTLPYATDLILTEVDLAPEGDAFFPEVAESEWEITRMLAGDGLTWLWRRRVDAARAMPTRDGGSAAANLDL